MDRLTSSVHLIPENSFFYDLSRIFASLVSNFPAQMNPTYPEFAVIEWTMFWSYFNEYSTFHFLGRRSVQSACRGVVPRHQRSARGLSHVCGQGGHWQVSCYITKFLPFLHSLKLRTWNSQTFRISISENNFWIYFYRIRPLSKYGRMFISIPWLIKLPSPGTAVMPSFGRVCTNSPSSATHGLRQN